MPVPVATADRRTDEFFLRRALALAVRGVEADPNPRVGAVVTDAAGAVVGEGWHEGAGTPHAEVVALRAAGAAARGGTAYVTLEPCAHTGRTGPCADALLAAGVARVVFAQHDPNPEAAGGAATLRSGRWPGCAGGVRVTGDVRVTGGVLAHEAEQLNRTWTHRHRTGRPFVTWKVATTLDGHAAAADGTSRWITSAEARADVHALRARCGAVIVGTGTALADDPALTVRHTAGPSRQPLRVVLGDRPLPPAARVLDASAPTLVLPGHDPADALARLAAEDVHHALLEGGPTLAAAFLRAGLVDEIVAYVAPVLLGAGAPTVGDLGLHTIGEALRLEPLDVTVLGPDVRLTARPLPAPPDPAQPL